MASRGTRLLLHSPVAAVKLMQSGAEDGIFVNLPIGTLSICTGPSATKRGMVEIYSKGHYYLVFNEDLSERAEPLLENIA